MKTTKILAAFAAALLMLASCQTGKNSESSSAPQEPSVSSAAPSSSLPESSEAEEGLVFDHSMALKYAKNFSVDYYKDGYKEITIADGKKFLVVPEGAEVPEGYDEEAVILKQPVENLLISSNPTISLINAMGALDRVSMTTTDADAWYIDEVRAAMTDGKLAYIGDYKEPDYEAITAGGVNLAIFSQMLTEDVEAQLEKLGVNILVDHASDEEHPLARVEWMKLYGALFNMEEEADKLTAAQEKLVDDLAELPPIDKTVSIFYITSNGSLYARNADDYMAKMVGLAGGKYALADLGAGKSGTTKMELEAFYEMAKDADAIIYVWSVGGKPASMADFLERAEIFADMKAVKEGNVWCTTPDYFQISDTLGAMVGDIRLMLEADSDTDTLTYLNRLK